MIGEYFAARPEEIDEELVELGPEGRFEIVSAKTHSTVTTGTLREALAAATDLVQVAERWTATDELQLSGWTVDETYEVLRSLARLAADARASGRELWFYWTL
jgi:hypothetical protein